MFQQRLQNNQPIFGHEIIYPLMQGYDSVAMDVQLEIGGSDQTFNMLMGRHLQQVYHHRDKWILTTPLINGLDGRKMSKSYGNFIPLTASANDMYALAMSATDDVIIEYFTLLTDVPDDDIAAMAAAIRQGANPMDAKKRLAHTLVTMYHDSTHADQAAVHWQQTVSEKKLPAHLPQVSVPNFDLPLLELAHLAQPATSRTQLRRLHTQGAIELLPHHVLRIGKRHHYQLVAPANEKIN
jgi:tyrosyl-tRNA synthetase